MLELLKKVGRILVRSEVWAVAAAILVAIQDSGLVDAEGKLIVGALAAVYAVTRMIKKIKGGEED